MKDWKNTVVGILSFLVTTLTIISAFLGGNDLSAGNGLSSLSGPTKIAAIVTLSLALCRAWIGWLQNYQPKLPVTQPPTPISKG